MTIKKIHLNLIIVTCFFACTSSSTLFSQDIPKSEVYLDSVKKDFKKKWPNNKTINLVFHGHSVPTGYRTLGIVKPLQSYPYETLKLIKNDYPFAVVNVIISAIGGENSKQGAERFTDEVLTYRPDVLFIDYALNDRSLGLEASKTAWKKMIEAALEKNIKVVLLTPTPDYREDILSEDSKLAQHSKQIRALSKAYNLGLIDVYAKFKSIAKEKSIAVYMAQNNHINDEGHKIVADLIYKLFEDEKKPTTKGTKK